MSSFVPCGIINFLKMSAKSIKNFICYLATKQVVLPFVPYFAYFSTFCFYFIIYLQFSYFSSVFIAYIGCFVNFFWLIFFIFTTFCFYFIIFLQFFLLLLSFLLVTLAISIHCLALFHSSFDCGTAEVSGN